MRQPGNRFVSFVRAMRSCVCAGGDAFPVAGVSNGAAVGGYRRPRGCLPGGWPPVRPKPRRAAAGSFRSSRSRRSPAGAVVKRANRGPNQSSQDSETSDVWPGEHRPAQSPARCSVLIGRNPQAAPKLIQSHDWLPIDTHTPLYRRNRDQGDFYN